MRAWRRLFDPSHDLAGDPACKRWAWLDLIQAAAFVDDPEYGIRRGEVRVHYPTLAKRWGWSYKQVRTFVKSLVDDRRLTPVRVSRGRGRVAIYAIVNYDTYQTKGGTPRQATGWTPPF